MTGFEDVAVGDDTPTTQQQAAAKGWRCELFDFGKAERQGVDFFNSGLVRRPDGLWLLTRMSQPRDGMPYGHNKIVAFKLDAEKKPMAGVILKFPNSRDEEQFEDPRAVYWNGQTWVGCANFTWYANGSWTGAHQMLGVFKDESPEGVTEESWSPLARRDPVVGSNKAEAGPTHGKHNKNLTYFFLRDTLYCVYTSDPWHVVQFGSKWEDQISYTAEGVAWRYGIIRGGTPPVLVDDKYYTFFHSSMPWRGRYRRYFMGAMAFEPGPPFRPLLWTQEPILIGSQNDPWHQRKPLVVFPCGALCEDGKWLVTLGINDLKSAWLELPHADLLKLLQPAPQIPGLALLSEPTPTPEYAPVVFQEGDEEETELSGGAENTGLAPSTPSTDGGGLRNQPESEISDSPAQNFSPNGTENERLNSRRWNAAKARDALAAKRAAGLPLGGKKKRRRRKKRLKAKA